MSVQVQEARWSLSPRSPGQAPCEAAEEPPPGWGLGSLEKSPSLLRFLQSGD